MIQLYGQNDSRWRRLKIPGTRLSIKNYGCCICCLAMLCRLCGKFETPETILNKLKYINGLVIWKSLTDVYPDIKFIKRIYRINLPVPDPQIDFYLKQNCQVIAEVRHKGIRHFVLVYSKAGNDYLMLDSLLNINGSFIEHYKIIYGIALFKCEAEKKVASPTIRPTQKISKKLNINTSIVDYLKYRGLKSDFRSRARLYRKIFNEIYYGTKSQNIKFLKYAKRNI